MRPPKRRPISITNLAERHLRHSASESVSASTPVYINHESSRKAFETTTVKVSPLRPVNTRISITNLAERHLRPLSFVNSYFFTVAPHINHESSRKAFETPSVPGLLPRLSRWISITNLAERHLRLAEGDSACMRMFGRYQSRI